MRAGRHRDVNTVVDENSRPRTANGFDRLPDQRQQLAVRHVPLANLDEMYARVRRCCHAPDQRGLGALSQAPAIADHADDGMHARAIPRLRGC